MQKILQSKAFIWLLLALPAIPMTIALIGGGTGANGKAVTEMLLHPTGETSARLLIITLMITPLSMLFPQAKFMRWMRKRRRYFGVASFFYALAHTLLYVFDMGSFRAIWGEFWILGIWTGWAAFLIFIPLAITSTDRFVKKMGPAWKRLQRWVYLAAILTLVHWIFVHNEFGAAMVHFVPLAALETYRIVRTRSLRASRQKV